MEWMVDGGWIDLRRSDQRMFVVAPPLGFEIGFRLLFIRSWNPGDRLNNLIVCVSHELFPCAHVVTADAQANKQKSATGTRPLGQTARRHEAETQGCHTCGRGPEGRGLSTSLDSVCTTMWYSIHTTVKF